MTRVVEFRIGVHPDRVPVLERKGWAPSSVTTYSAGHGVGITMRREVTNGKR